MTGGVLVALGPEEAQQPVAARGLIGGAAEAGKEGYPALLAGAPGDRSLRAGQRGRPEKAEMEGWAGAAIENDSWTIGTP